MNDTELNIAIAELRGWKKVRESDEFNFETWEQPDAVPPFNRIERHRMPRYTEDLNVCREAASGLSNTQWQRYRRHLNSVCNPGNYSIPPTRTLIDATARQRAEALYLTLK